MGYTLWTTKSLWSFFINASKNFQKNLHMLSMIYSIKKNFFCLEFFLWSILLCLKSQTCNKLYIIYFSFNLRINDKIIILINIIYILETLFTIFRGFLIKDDTKKWWNKIHCISKISRRLYLFIHSRIYIYMLETSIIHPKNPKKKKNNKSIYYKYKLTHISIYIIIK